MVATIIAYGMSAGFSVMTIAAITMPFKGKVKTEHMPVHLFLVVVLGVIAWGFARLGGI